MGCDGVYLYGQSPQPNTIGSEYLVFEVNQGQVIGGFYMPSSSFDCFYGSVEAQKLALTVVDSYEQTPHPYAVALQSESPVPPALPSPLTGGISDVRLTACSPFKMEKIERDSLPKLLHSKLTMATANSKSARSSYL